MSDEHLWELSSSFIVDGIAAGEQVMYFDDGTSENVLERLLDDGIDVAEVRESGQFEVVSAEATRAALTSPVDVMCGLLVDTIDAAVSSGFPGVRWTGQFNHALTRSPAGPSLREYETAMDTAISGRPARVLCLYDRARYPDEAIEDMRSAAPRRDRDGHDLRRQPAAHHRHLPGFGTAGGRGRPLQPSAGAQAAAHRAGQGTAVALGAAEIRLDLSSLRFVDVAGAVGLVHAAEEFPSSHRLVLEGVRPRVARILDRCGAPFAAQLAIRSYVERAPRAVAVPWGRHA